jgi:UPF0755 protein
MRRLILALAAVALLGLAAFAADALRFFLTPLPIAEEGLVYEIPPGATAQAVARDLAQRGLLDRPKYWRWLARIEDKARQIRVGEYRLEPGLRPRGLLDAFVHGATVQYAFTLVEGWTFKQLGAALRADPVLVPTLTDEELASVMGRLGMPGMHPEGWFYPDTYLFPRGTTDLELLRRSHRVMTQRLDAAWAERDPDLPLEDAYQALILASIVEKESAVADERDMIAGVFVGRLRRGMRLQTDPTVIYGMGDAYTGNIRKSDLQRDTPYNTYTRSGLPPTPIAMPGGGALRATVKPAETDALYFVAMGGGRHHFSETYEEHRQAVIEFLLGGKEGRYRGGP